jgi:hypothetical protein
MVFDLLAEAAKTRGLGMTLAAFVVADHGLREDRGAVRVRRS